MRYIGIDTPEPRPQNGAPEPFAAEATAANERLVLGETVHLESDVSDRDRFGRLLRYAWLRTGAGWLLVNRQLVREGLAEAKSYRPDTYWQDELDQAQRAAQADRFGIWGERAITTPVPFFGGGCHPAYPDFCIPPPPPDLDCADVRGQRFTVRPPDPHNFDGDFDGIGCEGI